MDLHHLYVQKDLRGQGVGRALVEAANDVARGLGARFLTVATMPDNPAAGLAYLACGFREEPVSARRFVRPL